VPLPPSRRGVLVKLRQSDTLRISLSIRRRIEPFPPHRDQRRRAFPGSKGTQADALVGFSDTGGEYYGPRHC
jgi:hypothetical protein